MIFVLLLAKVIEVPRSDGSVITGYLDVPQNCKNVVLITSGADAQSCYPMHQHFKKQFFEKGMGICTVEKRGFTKDRADKKEYWKHASFDASLADHLAVMRHLKNYNVIVLGGDVAAHLGHRTKPRAVVLIGVGGGWPVKDEMFWCFVNQTPSLFRSVTRNKLNKAFPEIMKNPTPNKFVCGYSYKWWQSYLKLHMLPEIKKIKCPILYVHGTKNTMCPIESADIVAKAILNRPNFTYRRLEGVGHMVWKADGENIVEWIEGQFSKDENKRNRKQGVYR